MELPSQKYGVPPVLCCFKNIATINIVDTEFEEENDEVVIVKCFGNVKIGLAVSQRYNGDSVLWFSVDEAQQIIS
ncbi:hypothetical protein [Clostridium aciditolerans]|uniref:Uncharacterized protein n=1 Tax=Clostridium aciditolerans TaxID=339861 RepID=A0A934HVW4_9CLOT|nr:hypothetical protein [Clostridium aciditolerans]MBI6871793.1 hypothetical protein [Clostridium aciditolerans]